MNYNQQTIQLLQKYLPIVLQSKLHFNKMVILIQSKYYFQVDETNLQKKLEKYLEASYRNDRVKVSMRLIRGEYDTGQENDEKWIWIDSREIVVLAQEAVENTKAKTC